MRKILFATTNKGKVNSLKNGLSQFNIEVIQESLELPEIRSNYVKDIAYRKVLYAYKKLRKPVVVGDSGFFIHSLNGFPRTFVNFVLDTIGIDGILRLVEKKGRLCEFRTCLAYMDSTLKEPVLFEDMVEGSLSEKVHKGKKRNYFWSDLFFVFIPKGNRKTLSEMAPEEYFRWREKARNNSSYIIQFGDWYTKHV